MVNKTFTIIAISLLIISYSVIGQTKKQFNIELKKDTQNTLLKYGPQREGKIVEGEFLEYTLLNGGYFSLGTSAGNSNHLLDNNCQLTFGHPYSLTSFIKIFNDGKWYNPSDDFELLDYSFHTDGDTLRIKFSDPNNYEVIFSIFENNSPNVIRLSVAVKNLSLTEENFNAAFVFDPALGKWGDGFLFINNQAISSKTVINEILSEDQIFIRERQGAAYGISHRLAFKENSVKQMSVANWREIAQIDEQNNYPDEIYDLALSIISNDTSLQSDSSFVFEMDIELLTPNFGDVFVRADIPTEFSIENNLLFPQNPNLFFELFNSSNNTFTNIKMKAVIPFLEIDTQTRNSINVNSNGVGYTNLGITINELYEDAVFPIEIKCLNNDQQIDSFIRNMFIPATPISDTGLVVVIDSLIQNHPKMGFRFNVKNEENGAFILNLKNRNLFLYQNEQRVEDFELMKDVGEGVTDIDIVFVLDVTGSMSNEIDQVKSNIIEFAESLEQEGYNYNLGLVTFLDVVENVYQFTSDVHEFQSWVGEQQAHGGGDYTENSLDALMEAAQMPFRESSNRIIIWITDANYHVNNTVTSLSVNEVTNALLLQGIAVHCIGNPVEQVNFYEQITIPTGGDYFSIEGNFRDILLDISKLQYVTDYLLVFNSDLELNEINSLKLEVHYAGLGGFAKTVLQIPAIAKKYFSVSCYPNPFNPITNISIAKQATEEGVIEIFDILGQRVKSITVPQGTTHFQYQWNAHSDNQNRLSSGVYILSVRIFNEHELVNSNSIKMMLLK